MSTLANGRAAKSASTFSMECAVSTNVRAPAATIWRLLTDAAGFSRWNSTVKSVEGEIALGSRIALVATVAPDRTFKLKVSELDPEKRMVWSDGFAPMFKGVRTFTLTPRDDGSTDFSMVEVFSGLMLPMIKGSLPDFGPPFERYAADLKAEAERTAQEAS